MPPLPVIANVWRASLIWNAAGTASLPVNVLHFSNPSGTASNFVTAFNAASTAAGAHQWDGLTTAFSLAAIDLLPLDGTTPTETVGVTSRSGQSTGDTIPNTAVVLSLKTAQRGSRGRGRMFMGPIGESLAAFGTISSTAATNIVTAWANFSSTMASNGWTWGVASYVHADFHPVTSLRCDTVLGTQRRRQERLN